MCGQVISPQRLVFVVVLAGSLLLGFVNPVAAGIVNIDDFNTVQTAGDLTTLTAESVNPTAVSGVIGGFQYLWVQGYSFTQVSGQNSTEGSTLSSGSQPGIVNFSAPGQFLVAKPFLEFGSPVGVIRYDGTANTGSASLPPGSLPFNAGDIKVNPTGLYMGGQPLNLTTGGNTALTIGSAEVVGGFASITITVYTGLGGSHVFTDTLPVPPPTVPPSSLDFLFTDFRNGTTSATSADFASVGAIVVQINTSRPIDTASAQTTVTLDPLTADIAPVSTPEPVSLLTWLSLTAIGAAAYRWRRPSLACGVGNAWWLW
jgi:hypothetical protein